MTTSPTNAAGDLVTVPRSVLQPFSDLAGVLFARNFNADDQVVAIWDGGKSLMLPAGNFFALRQALAASPAHATGAAMREGPQSIAADMKLIYAALQDYGLAIDDDSGSVDMTTLRAAYGVCDRLQTALAALSSPAPQGEVAPDWRDTERNDYVSDAQARDLFGVDDGEELPDDRVRVCDGEWVRIPGGYYFDKSAGPLHTEVASEACDHCTVTIAPEGEAPRRHKNTERNKIINRASTDLDDIVNGHDPEVHHLGNRVWDRLDKMACEIEALSSPAQEGEAAPVRTDADGVREAQARVHRALGRLLSACDDAVEGRKFVVPASALDEARAAYDGLDDHLAALFKPEGETGPAVAVKPLEWRDLSFGGELHLNADHPYGWYTIRKTEEAGFEYVVQGRPGMGQGFPSVEEAKAAARADYDRRIRSAIVGGSE